MTEVPESDSPTGGSDAPAYPPPYGAPAAQLGDDELAAALAAQTAMYTGPITIPVINSDPSFRPDPAAVSAQVPPPAEFAAPPMPIPPPPPTPAYVAPDEVAGDPEQALPAAPVPPSVGIPDAPVATTTASAALGDDELSRTVEHEAASGSTLDAILLLENELRRRQGLDPVLDADEPPAEVGASFGAAAWPVDAVPDAPVVPAVAEPALAPVEPEAPTAVPGWTDAPDPAREGEAATTFTAPVDNAAPVVDAAPVADAEAPAELGNAAELAPPAVVDEPAEQAWLTAPPPTFAPPPLVEPPATMPPTAVDPVDVLLLPPPSGAAVDAATPFLDAPPPELGGAVAMAPPVTATVGDAPVDAELEGIDALDRADIRPAIPVDAAAVGSVAPAPVPVSTATVVAVGAAPADAPRDAPAFAVEQPAIEPTPAERRAGHSARLFWLWFAANSSVVSIALGATLFAAGMSLRQTLVAIVAGVALSALPLGLGSLAGKWSGQPTMVVSRATFGLVGNIVPAILAVLSRVLWGAVLLWLLGATAAALLAPGSGDIGVAAGALGAGAVVAGAVATVGYELLHRVQRVLGILATVLVAVTIVATASHVDIPTALRTDDGSWLLALGGVVTVFSVVGLAWAQSSGDLARYQNPAGSGAANMLWASFGAIVPSLAIIAWGAVLAASDPERAADLARAPLATLLELVPGFLVLPLFGASAFGLVAGGLVAMYSGGLAIASAGLRAPRWATTLIASVLTGLVGVGLLLLGADTRTIVVDVATTLAVPVAAWAGIFTSEMMIRLRRFHSPSLLTPGGVYPAVRWVNLVGLLVITAVGYGLTTAELSGFTWQGYLLAPLGIAAGEPLATADAGVLVALALGFVLPLATGIPAIRRQERTREDAVLESSTPS